MSSFMNYDDATAVLGAYATQIKKVKPTEITYAAYQLLTPTQKAEKRYLITDYPEVSSVAILPVNPVDTTGLNIWIVDENA